MTIPIASRRAARRALVTGASGYLGGLLVPRLLDEGWSVRVLTRRRAGVAEAPWADRVDVVEGDAGEAADLDRALADVTVAYYLVHSMEGGDFVRRDRELAEGFARAAERAGVARIVYLGGLHPSDEPLSDHMASREEVGRIFLDSTVPTAVLQAAVVLGDGSASFDMLRYLAGRLPAMVAPKWLRNRLQPVAADDAVRALVGAASLPREVNRGFDIGGPDVLTYAELIQRYAAVTGLRPRLVVTVPVLTPRLASHWVGVVTPVPAPLAKPLVESLVHDAGSPSQLSGLACMPHSPAPAQPPSRRWSGRVAMQTPRHTRSRWGSTSPAAPARRSAVAPPPSGRMPRGAASPPR